MATRSVAAVFGGSGFIGRYVVKRLAQRGFIVRAAMRDTEAGRFLKPMGAVGQIVPLYASVTNDAAVHRVVEGASLVVNLVGILSESRKGEFQHVHAEGAGRVARLAAAAGVQRMVHVSAIGADPASPSEYGRSKAAGEQAVHAAFPGATIMRPSIVFGQEDQFFNRFGAMARLLPCMPVIAGQTRLQPVYVADVADAIMAALGRADAAGVTYELGGPRVWTMRELLAYVLKETGRRRRLIELPMGLARLQASLMELLPGKPLTRDQLLMLARDNVVAEGMPGLPELGIVPSPVELIVPAYLRRFQPGGGRRPVLPDQQIGGQTDLSFQTRDVGAG
ncbi:MAG TPA: complex I NDUFA9 subunit family protein [Acetobacteraceae bacterium]|nr:complex I NDUFA9 subunit family protein [Acetobacteraceae bacterium]